MPQSTFVAGLLRNLVARSGGPQPFSHESIVKKPRTAGATVTRSVCPYCAVGCGQLVYSRDGAIIEIEGDPDSPINHGTLCPKGAAGTAAPVPIAGRRCPSSGPWSG